MAGRWKQNLKGMWCKSVGLSRVHVKERNSKAGKEGTKGNIIENQGTLNKRAWIKRR